ncbi:flavin reductase family protein [Brevibacterium moorei]|uniref:flavin reductase family protein n=1 Tax=Brevibacterium moorei TaxID=2968457 RepID=UPI00211C43E2|nr:flavin reductase family protein [Brevibacterium sp. 68QC2CO]MCQ9386862.1 flavin reductase family protein [Brevibacterium sp. 68QC2CO]
MENSSDMADATAERYRSVAGRIVKSVAVLSVESKGAVQAITVDSYLDVSYDPPTMAVSVYAGSRMGDALDTTRRMTLSVLAPQQKGTAQWLGTPGQPTYGLLNGVELADGTTGYPAHIPDAVAVFEMEIVQRLEIETHTLVVGHVAHCAQADGAGLPLLYAGGEYFMLP